MKKFDGINYGFRPVSYWGDTTVQQAILRGVKGTLRRKGITTALAKGELEKVGEDLLSAELTHAVRTRVGRIHPAFLGGEYLPSFESTETEIARIELQSTTNDVISIRASLGPERIHYRVVDEYGECFQVKPATSRLSTDGQKPEAPVLRGFDITCRVKRPPLPTGSQSV